MRRRSVNKDKVTSPAPESYKNSNGFFPFFSTGEREKQRETYTRTHTQRGMGGIDAT